MRRVVLSLVIALAAACASPPPPALVSDADLVRGDPVEGPLPTPRSHEEQAQLEREWPEPQGIGGRKRWDEDEEGVE